MDILSLAAGALVALILAIVIYTQRNRISALRSSAQRGAGSLRRQLSKSLDQRYREAVTGVANSWHLAGHVVTLEQVGVLPRFYTLPRPHDPLESEDHAADYEGPLNVIPVTPDWPQVLGSYQLPATKTLHRILRGGDSIALLGLPGSGRTTALALMAILVARQTHADQEGGLLTDPRLPILIHLGDVNLTPEFLALDPDPLAPLLDAAGSQLRGLATAALASIRNQFAGGGGLILLDAWDELPNERRMQIINWLRDLMARYPGNQYVMVGSARGYKPLVDLGLVPVFLMPWGNTEYNELARLWSEAWPQIGGTRREPAAVPDQELVRAALRGNRSRSPLDATLKMWATFAKDDPGMGQLGWCRAYVERSIPARELRVALERVAEQWLWASRTEGGLSIEQVTALVDSARSSLPTRPSVSTPDFIYAVTGQTRILSEHVGRRISFTQPVVGAYLAAEALKNASYQEALLDDYPVNDLVMPFLAQIGNVEPYVQARLNEATSVGRDQILSLALWAAEADTRAAWRGEVFKRLTQLFIAPSEFPLVRERAMAALVASRDRNVTFIFKTGLQNDDKRIRILSALGLGALGDPETLIPLGEALDDPEPWVEAAVSLAMGALGTKTALNYMIQTMVQGRELARRAVAEMLATNMVGEGHDILKDALQEEDPQTRRAAIYGLQAVGADWVYPLLDHAQSRDDQWMVRTAAQNALEMLRRPEQPLYRPRQPEQSDWLVVWLAERDQAIEPGPRAVAQMIRALQEGDESTRRAAAESLGALHLPEAVTPLYGALKDLNPDVRDAAYRALTQISSSMGYALPSVV